MVKRIVIAVYLIAGLIAVTSLGWLAHTYRIDAHILAFFQPRNAINVLASTSAEPVAAKGQTDEDILNSYWLQKINDLRAQRSLKPLALDARLEATAKVWAVQMGTSGVLRHDRPNGESVQDWIKAYGLPFTERGPKGWSGNYFTENIGRGFSDASIQGDEKALDQVLNFMVDEGPDGDHYRTIFSSDWNRYGGGFYFAPAGDGRVQIYMAFHYASLQDR